MNCKFTKRVDGRLENISPKDMAETKFTGICVLKLSDFFVGSFKTIITIPKEFLVKEIENDMSYFDDDIDGGLF